MKPFVLLTTRPEDDVARTELASFQRFSGLPPADLLWVRLEREAFPDLHADDISGIYLGGSPFTVSEPEHTKSALEKRAEAELFGVLDRVFAEDIPFFGCCYGVGALGTHQGGIVDRTYGEPLSAVQLTVTEAGRQDPVVAAAQLPDRLTGLVGHKEAVRELPPNATELINGEACPVQMFRVGTRQYATQFHPELDVPGVIERSRAYQGHGYFEPAEMEKIHALLSHEQADDPPRLLRAFATVFAADG